MTGWIGLAVWVLAGALLLWLVARAEAAEQASEPVCWDGYADPTICGCAGCAVALNRASEKGLI